jgi:Flp pilus assembly protein TadG
MAAAAQRSGQPSRTPRLPSRSFHGAPVANPAHRERGQATVEFALVVPFLVLFLLAFVQVALLARDDVLVVHAARAAAREAAVGSAGSRVRAAVTHVLPGAQVAIGAHGPVGDPVEVTVRYTAKTDVPLVGALFPDHTFTATATMRIEQ